MNWQGSWHLVAGMLLSGLLAFAAPQTTAVPGTLNYLEGRANVNGQVLNSQSLSNQVLQPGETLDTQNGKVEILLTPGVFLRLGENSEARMVSSGLADIEIALLKGHATVEADYWSKDNRLKIEENGAAVQIDKKGLYLLDADQPFAQVLDGKATVLYGDQHVNLGKGREAYIESSGKLKARDFDEKGVREASLVRWSRLRSQAEAQASFRAAENVYVNTGWYGPGWYWADPYWSFLPADGILYSPFGWGWGFYSPGFIYYGGYYRGGYYPGLAGVRGGFRGPAIHAGGVGARGGFVGGFHGGFAGGFHGGFAGGGVRGGRR